MTLSSGQRIVALAAALFGIATLVAGARVLSGTDPGYPVYRPLLIFNTAMGLAYVTAGVLMWRRVASGRNAAALILGFNVLVLAAVLYLYRTGGAVAPDSVRAMIFRTGVWLLFFLALASMSRRRRAGVQ